MSHDPTPPRLARQLVAAVLPVSVREFLLGDLDEQFAIAAAEAGRGRARRQYWSQAVRAIWHAPALARGSTPFPFQGESTWPPGFAICCWASGPRFDRRATV